MVVANDDVTVFQRILWVLNTIFHQLVAIFTIFVLWVTFQNASHNTSLMWHIVLSTAAYFPLMAEGIILFSGDNVWTQRLERTNKYWLHGILLGISILAVTIGIGYDVHSKNEAGRQHFQSYHAITGLVSWVLALASVFLGLFSWHAQRLKSFMRPVIFKFVHNFLGMDCYIFGIISLYYGLTMKRSFGLWVTLAEQNACLVLVFLITFWSLLAAFKSAYNQLKSVFV